MLARLLAPDLLVHVLGLAQATDFLLLKESTMLPQAGCKRFCVGSIYNEMRRNQLGEATKDPDQAREGYLQTGARAARRAESAVVCQSNGRDRAAGAAAHAADG